jgi:hypothetical protein
MPPEHFRALTASRRSRGTLKCEGAGRGIGGSGGPDGDAWIVEQETGVVVGQHAREVKRVRGIGKPPARTLVLEADVALLEALDPEILCPAADRSNAPKVFLTSSVNSGVAGSRPITNHRGDS